MFSLSKELQTPRFVLQPDPSYKNDLELCGCLGRENPALITKEIGYKIWPTLFADAFLYNFSQT